MIPKGNARGGGRQLATHLLNAMDNERVEVAEIRHAVAQDLHGAFAEWSAAATATNCEKYLYSLSVNPDPRQRTLTRAEIFEFISRIEKTLGLADQPRAVVFHCKNGRDHCHVAWSRIDTERLRAVQLSHDRQKLRTVTQQFARDMGLQLPKSMQKNRGVERYKDRDRRSSHAEKQQEERTGITKEQRRKDITEAWRQADNGQSFIRALQERGYTLARGDKVPYAVVDRHGEIHSLPKQIEGVNTAKVKERLIDYPPEKLPEAAKAQEMAREKGKLSLKEHFRVQADSRRAGLIAAQTSRRAVLEKHRGVIVQRHDGERQTLRGQHTAENAKIEADRQKREAKGLAAFLGRITGISTLLRSRQEVQDTKRTAKQQEAADIMQRGHERELRDFSRQERAIARVEKRENRSLEARLRREIFIERQVIPGRESQLTAREFRDNARDITTGPEAKPQAEKTEKSGISEKFAEALRAKAAQKDHTRTKDTGRQRTNDPSPH